MTKFGRSIDPFQINLLQSLSGCVSEHGFSESDDSLLNTGHGTLEQEVVVLDFTVSDETAQTITFVSNE